MNRNYNLPSVVRRRVPGVFESFYVVDLFRPNGHTLAITARLASSPILNNVSEDDIVDNLVSIFLDELSTVAAEEGVSLESIRIAIFVADESGAYNSHSVDDLPISDLYDPILHQGMVRGYSRFIPVTEFNSEFIFQVLGTISQSEREADIFTATWKVVIDPNTTYLSPYIRVGKSIKIPSNVKGNNLLYEFTWRDQELFINGENIKLNCMCVALAAGMAEPLTTKPSYEFISNVKLQAFKLMEVYGMDKELQMTIAQKFVLDNPKYRVCILNKQSIRFLYTGKEYVIPEIFKNNNNGRQIPRRYFKYTIFIYAIHETYINHIAFTPFITTLTPASQKFCYCCCQYYKGIHGHTCESRTVTAHKKHEQGELPCHKCNKYKVDGKHICPFVECKNCKCHYEKVQIRHNLHRCVVMNKKTETPKFGEGEDGDFGLFVFDFESRLDYKESRAPVISDFVMVDGKYPTNMGESIAIFSNREGMFFLNQGQHVVNFACLQNVLTGEMMIWDEKNSNPIEGMVDYLLNHNKGNNVVLAHNFSGYDGRFIYEELARKNVTRIEPNFDGTKLIDLKIRVAKNRYMYFRDTLKYLSGSLKNLAREYRTEENLSKGYFPHLFNRVENYDYIGRIPDKKYFDLPFTIKTEKELEEFNEWYDNQLGVEWNFSNELRKYCIQDVKILASIVSQFTRDMAAMCDGEEPFHKSTAPSYLHNHTINLFTKGLELPDKKEDENAYVEKIETLARDKTMAVLNNTEYWFIRKALRGGRTDAKTHYRKLSPEEIAAGLEIRYVDINSQYPFQQVIHDFPAGYPTIHVYEPESRPCIKHPGRVMGCSTCLKDVDHDPFGCDIKYCYDQQPTESEMMADDFFGPLSVTLIAPKNLYHPAIIVYIEELKKCIPSLRDEDLKKISVLSEVLKVAILVGYKVVKVHRYDKYSRKPSLWAAHGIIQKFYLEKMRNSQKIPYNIQDHADYLNSLWEGFGDLLPREEEKWAKNPAKKAAAKTGLNSCWGKHAEKPIRPKTMILKFDNDDHVRDFFRDLINDEYYLNEFVPFGDTGAHVKYTAKITETTVPTLKDNAYLPAAVFVPAYGRLQLFEQLHKLGDRALYNDTDSIIYLYDPTKYNIPEGGMFGQWERESVDVNNGGIQTFVALGPKSYGFKCANGHTEMKIKGLSLRHAHSDLVNFKVMERLVLQNIEAKTVETIHVPQMTFKYNISEGVKTVKLLKRLAFNHEELKGELRGAKLYPFGHE